MNNIKRYYFSLWVNQDVLGAIADGLKTHVQDVTRIHLMDVEKCFDELGEIFEIDDIKGKLETIRSVLGVYSKQIEHVYENVNAILIASQSTQNAGKPCKWEVGV